MSKIPYTADNQGLQNDFAQMNPAVTALGSVSGGTATFAHSTDSQVISITLGASTTFTITAGTNITAGDTFSAIITQDATGSRLATWPSNFKKAGGALTLSTGANAVDVVSFVYDGTNYREVARALATA